MPNPTSRISKPLSDEAIAWVVRVRSGRCTEEDRLQLARWRRLSADHEQAYREACRL